MKALTNACIYDFHNLKKDCYVLFDSEIEEVGSMMDFKGAEDVFDCSGCIVMPSLTNCHTHIYSTFSRGMDAPFNPKTFKDILAQLWWKLDSQLNANSVYLSGLVYGMDLIRSGVTAVIDHHASGLVIKGSLNSLRDALCSKVGLRGVFCFETSDRFNIDDCIEENMDFAEENTQNYAGLFGMHASMSLSEDTLKKISQFIRNTPIHIHVAESLEDEEDCMSRYGMSIVERLDKYSLLNKNSILAHCVHINENEAALIRERGCFVAVNPTSNMNNAVGLADFDLFRRNKIKCMVGNDGLGANITRDYQNTLYAFKNRIGSPTGVGLNDLIGMIDNGYEYIGNALNIKIGRFQKGYKADMISISYNPPTPMDGSNMGGHLFFGIFDNFHPRCVWVSGKCLMKDYKLTQSIGGVYESARDEAREVWDRVSKIK